MEPGSKSPRVVADMEPSSKSPRVRPSTSHVSPAVLSQALGPLAQQRLIPFSWSGASYTASSRSVYGCEFGLDFHSDALCIVLERCRTGFPSHSDLRSTFMAMETLYSLMACEPPMLHRTCTDAADAWRCMCKHIYNRARDGHTSENLRVQRCVNLIVLPGGGAAPAAPAAAPAGPAPQQPRVDVAAVPAQAAAPAAPAAAPAGPAAPTEPVTAEYVSKAFPDISSSDQEDCQIVDEIIVGTINCMCDRCNPPAPAPAITEDAIDIPGCERGQQYAETMGCKRQSGRKRMRSKTPADTSGSADPLPTPMPQDVPTKRQRSKTPAGSNIEMSASGKANPMPTPMPQDAIASATLDTSATSVPPEVPAATWIGTNRRR